MRHSRHGNPLSIQAQRRQPLLLLLLSCRLCLPPKRLQIPRPRILIIAVFIAIPLPAALLEQHLTCRFLRGLGLLLGCFLVETLLLPLGEGFGRDGREGACELVPLGFKEVFEG